jgi:hypothetical protein
MNQYLRNTWVTLIAMLFCTVAVAAVQEGTYQAGDSKIYIKTIRDGAMETSYALLVHTDTSVAGDPQYMGLFRIEEVNGDTQAWVGLMQTSDNILGANYGQAALYEVRILGRSSLRLTLTSYASRYCTWQPPRDFEFVEAGGWSALPTNEVGHNSDKAKLTFKPTRQASQSLLSGWVKLRENDLNIGGNFMVTELLPGVGVARENRLDSESLDGRSQARPISALIVSFSQKSFWRGNQSTLGIIAMRPDEQKCIYPAASVAVQ